MKKSDPHGVVTASYGDSCECIGLEVRYRTHEFLWL
jgi:hypothetical protein